MFSLFIQSLIVGYSGALMPGTLLTYTFDRTLKKGGYAGVIISLGHAAIELVVIFLLLFGLGNILSNDLSRIIIGLLGGFLLVLMGINMIKEINNSNKNKDNNDKKGNRLKVFNNMLLGGAVLSLLNPYFIFWWAIIGLSFITKAYRLYGYTGVAVFFMGHILADISWFGFVSISLNKVKRFITSKAYKVIIIILGICLIAFGFKFVTESIQLF